MTVSTIDFTKKPPKVKKSAGPPPEMDDGDDMPTASDRMTSAVAASAPPAENIAGVLADWATHGRLVHEPTGIAALDEVTGGGPVYGTRWAWLGAPDAGKTAVLVQIGHDYAQRGIFVGFVAVDEEAGDLVTRLAQRVGYSRLDCEEREADIVRHMGNELTKLPIRFYGARHTIESAAADLHEWAKASTPEGQPIRCFLAIDSIQTVRCDAALQMELSGREVNPRALVTANVSAARAVASLYRLIAFFTSEMARRAYQSQDAADNSNDMAAGKESGAIEYSARVQLTLRSVKGETDLLELTPSKNKHGRSGQAIYLRIDRARMTLSETSAPSIPDERAATTREVAEDAGIVLHVIVANPGVGVMSLRAKVRAGGRKIGQLRFDGAIEFLKSSGRIEDRPDVQGLRSYPHYFALAPEGSR